MPLPSTGILRLSQIQGEFGGANPVSLSEYYRNGAFVLNGLQNQGVPATGPISASSFRSASKTVVVNYAIIGGGGAGGYGLEDGGGSGRGGSGINSTIVGPGVNISAAGGLGGGNGAGSGNGDPAGFRDGDASFYGAGGAGGGNGFGGSAAPTTSYGAGGGGAGGDSGSTYDSSGNSGEGGFAGTRVTGSLTLDYGTSLTISIGSGGIPTAAGVYRGGAGANGFCSLVFDGKTVNFTTTTAYVVL